MTHNQILPAPIKPTDYEKIAFVGTLLKGGLGLGKTVIKNPGASLTAGFGAMQAGDVGSQSAQAAGNKFVGVPSMVGPTM